MNHTSFLIKALNDLIQINKDRVLGYLQASNEMNNIDKFLKDICLQIVQEGKKNIKELSIQIKKLSSQLPQSNNNGIKLIKLWNDAAESNDYDELEPCFASCVCSEDAVQKVYEDTLLTYTFMPIELRTLIMQQKKKIGYAKKEIMGYLNLNNIVATA